MVTDSLVSERPPNQEPITLVFDKDVVDHFHDQKDQEEYWRHRIDRIANAALRRAAFGDEEG